MNETYLSLRSQGVIFPSPQKPKKETQSELDKQKEEEEFQLALALSLSESENKQQYQVCDYRISNVRLITMASQNEVNGLTIIRHLARRHHHLLKRHQTHSHKYPNLESPAVFELYMIFNLLNRENLDSRRVTLYEFLKAFTETGGKESFAARLEFSQSIMWYELHFPL